MPNRNKIGSFFKVLVSGLSYYENIILRVISACLLLFSFILIFFTPGKWRILFSLFTFFLLFKEYFQRLESDLKEERINELEKNKNEKIQYSVNSFKEQILHSLLEFLGKFFKWKGGSRFTIFTLAQVNGGKSIKCVYRTSFGSPAGVPCGHKAYFSKGKGLPGIAWGDAWDKENLEDLIDRIKLGKVPEKILSANTGLKEYYKNNFNIDDEIFDSLGDDKNQIKSYLSVGVVGQRNELSYVLSIDSTEADAFDDFQTLKDIKQGKVAEITRIRGEMEAYEEINNKNSTTTEEVSNNEAKQSAPLTKMENDKNPSNTLINLETSEEILNKIPQTGKEFFEAFKALKEGKCQQRGTMGFDIMKQTIFNRPKIDRFVYTFGMILKLIETIMKEKISF